MVKTYNYTNWNSPNTLENYNDSEIEAHASSRDLFNSRIDSNSSNILKETTYKDFLNNW